MKRFLSLFLCLVMLICCCACGDKTSKKKKKIVVIKKQDKVVVVDPSDDDSSEENTTDTEVVIDSNVVSKKLANNIGKNYYVLKPIYEHPGVVGMDAVYTFSATDKQGIKLDNSNIVLTSNNAKVKIDGETVIVPYSVRSGSDTVTISMYNKEHKNRTGTYTFKFLKFSDKPTLRDDFDSFNENLWVRTSWKEEPINNAFVEDGNMVLRVESEQDGTPYVTSGDFFRQAYGCFSISMKMPSQGSGLASFWICGEYLKNVRAPAESGGEIDIVEYFPDWGERYAGTVHWNGWSSFHESDGDENLKVLNPSSQFHTYSAVWTPYAIYWYCDGKLMRTYTGSGVGLNSGELQLRMQMIVHKDDYWGSTYDPTEYPFETRYDWVEVYSLIN